MNSQNDGLDEDDPEPDVLPGAGRAAHDLRLVREPPPADPPETRQQVLSRAVALMLVTWRLDRGPRQRDVARRSGVTQPQLSRLAPPTSPSGCGGPS